jgi:hypothetical protein
MALQHLGSPYFKAPRGGDVVGLLLDDADLDTCGEDGPGPAGRTATFAAVAAPARTVGETAQSPSVRRAWAARTWRVPSWRYD